VAFINEPEEPMSRDQAAAILKRTLNELPTIAAGTGAALYVIGLDADLTGILERAEGIVGFALWLFARHQLAGPVTLHNKKQARDDALNREIPK